MIQIKTFRFIGSKTDGLDENRNPRLKQTPTKDIDKTINDFLAKCNGKYVNLYVSILQLSYHNNCGYHNNELVYTLVYDDGKYANL